MKTVRQKLHSARNVNNCSNGCYAAIPFGVQIKQVCLLDALQKFLMNPEVFC